MKVAKMSIRVVEFICPDCNEHLESEASGYSHMFDLADPLPETLDCSCCGAKLKVPEKAKKLKGVS
jgi:acetone carboxylase gamma subunit